MIGAAAFTLASVFAAFSTSAIMLIAARAALGVAGATLMPSTLALISNLFADRTSAVTTRANQLRLWFAVMAYVLLSALRRIALAGSRLAKATCGSIRLKLLKIGAQLRRSVRRIRIAMASACPYAQEFALAHARLSI